MIVSMLSGLLGAPEAALRLLLSLLLSYPLLIFHRHHLYRKDPTIQHIFFIICGLSFGLFNNGFDVVHSMICVVAAWLILVFMGGSIESVVVANVFQMGYLLLGYYFTASTSYDIKWTMPHCVLTLRLIALTWDMYDGSRDKKSLSAEQAETALVERPSLLEIAAQTYFPASYMVGPQFSMKRYQDFIHGRLFSSHLPDSVSVGLERGAIGLFFIAIFQLSSSWLPESYLASDEFDVLPFYWKCIYVGLWGKFTLYKYTSCWLMSEGAIIISGLSYNGVDSSGLEKWDACKNIKVTHLEKAFRFNNIIEAFNVNTNVWVAKYVYKRLKFLNNRNISALSALMFLAVWHGLHSGYYACFSLEFLVNFFEKGVESLLAKYPKFSEHMENPVVKPIRLVLMKIYLMVLFGYCLAPFVLLKSYRWWKFFKSMYFLGHLFFGGWIVYRPLVKKILDSIYGPPEKKTVEAKKTEELKKTD